MSRISNGFISTLLKQIYLVDKHQELAEKNCPNQLPEMTDSLNSLIEALGNANAYEIASIDEEKVNVLIERTRLESGESMPQDADFDENLDGFSD